MTLNSLPTILKDKKIGQIGKFLITGFSNTAIDFIILSTLLFLAPAPSSVVYIVYKVLAFSGASTNSYLLNKYYVFKSHALQSNENKQGNKQTINFVISCLIGLLVNVAVSTVIFSWLISKYPDMSTFLAGNIGALSGTAICLWWNFIAYKYVVFKTVNNSSLSTA